jgi:hypothetical protein
MAVIGLSRSNVLLPQGHSQTITARDYRGALRWGVSGNRGVTLSSESGSDVVVSIATNAVVGSQATLTVSDEDGLTGQTTIMVGPASGHTSRCLLIYGTDATGQTRAGLLNADDGTFTWLPAIPGVMTSEVLSNARPTTQVLRASGDDALTCYILNLDSLPDWAIG